MRSIMILTSTLTLALGLSLGVGACDPGDEQLEEALLQDAEEDSDQSFRILIFINCGDTEYYCVGTSCSGENDVGCSCTNSSGTTVSSVSCPAPIAWEPIVKPEQSTK